MMGLKLWSDLEGSGGMRERRIGLSLMSRLQKDLRMRCGEGKNEVSLVGFFTNVLSAIYLSKGCTAYIRRLAAANASSSVVFTQSSISGGFGSSTSGKKSCVGVSSKMTGVSPSHTRKSGIVDRK